MRHNRNTLNPVQHILIFLVRLYRWTLSPAMTFLFGPLSQCRFTPSCSQFAAEAIRTHGGLAGSWLAANRLCRCHPWGKSGFDPVPRVAARGQSPDACGMHRQGSAAPFVGTATDSVSGYHR